MSLHAILEVIRGLAQDRIKEIEKRAYSQACEILTNTRLQAESVKEQACAAAFEPAIRERARILHRARLEALQIIGNARETLVDSALNQTHGRLASLRADPVYPQVLRKLLQEVVEEFHAYQGEDGKDQPALIGWLEADVRDRPVLERLITELGLAFPVRYTLECWGGLSARSEDSRLVVINTINARLERATPYLRRSLAALYEEGQAAVPQPLKS